MRLLFLHRSLIVKNQQNLIELVTRPEADDDEVEDMSMVISASPPSGAAAGAECWAVMKLALALNLSGAM